MLLLLIQLAAVIAERSAAPREDLPSCHASTLTDKPEQVEWGCYSVEAFNNLAILTA